MESSKKVAIHQKARKDCDCQSWLYWGSGSFYPTFFGGINEFAAEYVFQRGGFFGSGTDVTAQLSMRLGLHSPWSRFRSLSSLRKG